MSKVNRNTDCENLARKPNPILTIYIKIDRLKKSKGIKEYWRYKQIKKIRSVIGISSLKNVKVFIFISFFIFAAINVYFLDFIAFLTKRLFHRIGGVCLMSLVLISCAKEKRTKLKMKVRKKHWTLQKNCAHADALEMHPFQTVDIFTIFFRSYIQAI